MWGEFNKNLCIFSIIIVLVGTTWNSVRAQAPVPIIDSKHVTELQSPQQFQDVVLASKDKILVQFHAPWCTTCKTLSPVLVKKIDEQNGKIKLTRMDLGNKELQIYAQAQGVKTVPLIYAYKNGQIVDQLIGFKDQQTLLQFIEKQLEDI